MGSEETHRHTILLVDDDPLDLELTIRAVQSAGASAKIEVAEDGQAALAWIEHRQPDLILLDVKLPKLSGLRVLERLRQDGRLAHVPIVMLSNSDEPCDLEAARHAGADGYLVKPVGFDEYHDAVVGAVRWWLVHNRLP